MVWVGEILGYENRWDHMMQIQARRIEATVTIVVLTS